MAIEEIPLSEQAAAEIPVVTGGRQRGLWRDAFRQTLRKRSAKVGVVILALLVIMAVFAPLIAPYGEREVLIATEGLEPATEPCIHVSVAWIPDVPGPAHGRELPRVERLLVPVGRAPAPDGAGRQRAGRVQPHRLRGPHLAGGRLRGRSRSRW